MEYKNPAQTAQKPLSNSE